MFFAVALSVGFTASLLAAVFERQERHVVAAVLVYMVGTFCLMILGMAVTIVREPSLRRLTLVGFVTLVAPWLLLLLIQVCGLEIAHDAGGFSLMYYMWSCTIAGIGLFVMTCIRFVQERRKRERPTPE